MEKNSLNITYEVYAGTAEMSPEDRELVNAAIASMPAAYAPYSHFHVGAAVRMSDGTIVTGSNQENAAYPSGLCAERTALFAASSGHPDLAVRSIAIAGGLNGILSEDPTSPCGACRQVMAQYQNKAGSPVSIIMAGSGRIFKFSRVDDILPFIFDGI